MCVCVLGGGGEIEFFRTKIWDPLGVKQLLRVPSYLVGIFQDLFVWVNCK